MTFRPKAEHRTRLEQLAKATERPLSYLLEKTIEAHLPLLEMKYQKELDELAKKESAANSSAKVAIEKEAERAVRDRYYSKKRRAPSGQQQ